MTWGAAGPGRALVAIVVVALIGLIPSGVEAAETRGVRHLTLTFVDRSRPTEDPTATRSAPDRTLVTEVYLPRKKGRHPLIVMAHGNAGNPGKLTQLLTAWARAGYAVVAPTFPLTNDLTDAPSVIVDFVNQPADVSFVIDRVLHQNRRRGAPLHGRIDARNIGMAGHSLGGGTAYGVAFNPCCRDRRIDAVAAMDAVRPPYGTHEYAFRGKPLLLIHLIGDPVVKYQTSAEIYAVAAPPKYFMTITQGVHFEPFEDAPNAHDDAVRATTIAFWDGYLRDDAAARRRIVAAGTKEGVSSVTARVRS